MSSLPSPGNLECMSFWLCNQSTNLALPIFITWHENISSITFSLSEKNIKDFNFLITFFSILIIISNMFLTFLAKLIIAILKPLCAYFGIWVTSLCFRCLSVLLSLYFKLRIERSIRRMFRLWWCNPHPVRVHPFLWTADGMEVDHVLPTRDWAKPVAGLQFWSSPLTSSLLQIPGYIPSLVLTEGLKPDHHCETEISPLIFIVSKEYWALSYCREFWPLKSQCFVSWALWDYQKFYQFLCLWVILTVTSFWESKMPCRR